jgi:hypothetical protein
MSGYRVNTTHVVSDVFDDGEAAVIDLRSGMYFSLNGTGALLWPLIVAGTTRDALVEHAHAQTSGGPEVGGCIDAFLADLVSEGLVEEVDAPAGAADAVVTSANGDRVPFVAPELQRFEDLQELLLLDPIHDVAEQGWPYTPPA